VRLALAATVLLAGYLLACWLWPFSSCLVCGGNGKRRSPSGRAWRNCRRCRGTGTRLRVGRHLWNYLAGVKGRAR
jgi:hypothetical protein